MNSVEYGMKFFIAIVLDSCLAFITGISILFGFGNPVMGAFIMALFAWIPCVLAQIFLRTKGKLIVTPPFIKYALRSK